MHLLYDQEQGEESPGGGVNAWQYQRQQQQQQANYGAEWQQYGAGEADYGYTWDANNNPPLKNKARFSIDLSAE